MMLMCLFVLCLCAGLPGIEGARTQNKVVELALEKARKQEASQSMTDEAEEKNEDEEEDNIKDHAEDVLQPKGCKRWCTKVRVGFPIDLAYVKKQTDAKCQHEMCKECKGGGLTIPDCREKEVVVEADKGASEDGEDVPQCTESPAGPVQACKLTEGEEELTCTHVSTPWCMPPSRNPGHKYRAGSRPLCCDTEQSVIDSDMEDVDKEVTSVKEKLENEKVEETKPPEPVPVCAVGHTFEVDSFKRRGKTVHVCRDKDNSKFANKVCCDAEAFKLLEDEAKAEEICPTVKSKYCKTNVGVFNKKRKKYPGVPSTFSCKRMYMCCDKKDECFGPVPNQSLCKAEHTKLEKNRPATKACVAVKN